jgi:hypothetical protein
MDGWLALWLLLTKAKNHGHVIDATPFSSHNTLGFPLLAIRCGGAAGNAFSLLQL